MGIKVFWNISSDRQINHLEKVIQIIYTKEIMKAILVCICYLRLIVKNSKCLFLFILYFLLNYHVISNRIYFLIRMVLICIVILKMFALLISIMVASLDVVFIKHVFWMKLLFLILVCLVMIDGETF